MGAHSGLAATIFVTMANRGRRKMADKENLYRGKCLYAVGDLSPGDWVEGQLVIAHEPADIMTGAFIMPKLYAVRGCQDPGLMMFAGFAEVDPTTVSQYTGLTDKYGTRIFEGDIVSVKNDQGEIYRFIMAFGECGDIQNIKRTVGYMGFHFLSGNDETNKCMEIGVRNDPLYWLNAYDCEVIGNRWDNPELMGGEQNE